MGKVEKFFVPRIKMLPDGFGIVGGQGKKFFNVGPFQQIPRLNDMYMKGDGKAVGRSALFFLMVLVGQKIKGSALKDAFGGGFSYPGLAKENSLPTGGNRLTNR